MDNLFFTDTHEWVKLNNDIATIGITDYAQSELGDIVFLDLITKKGDNIKIGECFSTIESVKAVSDIYTPVSGAITDINNMVIEKPEVINSDPTNKGWLIKIQIKDINELEKLKNESEYKLFISEQ